MSVSVLAESFVVSVVQELVLAIGLALAGANMFALVTSRRARRRYEADLAVWQAAKKKKGGVKMPKPAEPKQVQVGPAVFSILAGLLIALVALAAITFDWVE
jgi:hypothetical protein